jgi:prevent-host-death family protein
MQAVGEWQVQEAKSRLSELLRCAKERPQTITQHGRPTAVVLSVEDYHKLAGRHGQKNLADVVATAPFPLDCLAVDRSREAGMREMQL